MQGYRRGQVEWALWRSFIISTPSADKTSVPKVFAIRIKRLLEIDRDPDLIGDKKQPEAAYAFNPGPTAAGVETAYSPVDAFCLATGLDLLDAGFKQRDVVFLMRHLRTELEAGFDRMLRPPSLLSRQPPLAAKFPKLPSYAVGKVRYTDNRQFVIIQKVEMKEIIPKSRRSGLNKTIFLEPIYCDGVEKLGKALYDIMPHQRRAVTILELAGTAQAVSLFLDEAPNIRRGRPKS
jgi:hypothetical protein